MKNKLDVCKKPNTLIVCKRLAFLLFFLSIFGSTKFVQASISTLTIDDGGVLIYSSKDAQLFNLSEIDLFNYQALVESSLMTASNMNMVIGDVKALNFISQLFKDSNPKAPFALANYIKRYPKDVLGFQLAAIELFSKEKYYEASLALRNILSAQPKYTPASTLLGVTWLMLKEYEKGAEQLRQSVSAEFADPMALRYLAWDASRRGDTKQAKGYVQRSLKYYGLPTVQARLEHLELAELHRQLGEFSNIIDLFKLLANNSDTNMQNELNLEAVSRFFEAATELSNKKMAQVANKKLENTPAYNSYPGHIARARLLAMESKTDQGIALLQTLKSEQPQMESRRLLELAKLYAYKKDNNNSLQNLEAYLAIYGEQVTLGAVQEYVMLSVAIGKGNQALRYLKSLNNKYPENNNLSSILVEALIQANDLTAANQMLDKILKNTPNFAPAYYQKGILLYNQGDNEQATAAFRQSLTIDPKNIPAWMALIGSIHDHRTHSHSSAGASIDHQDMLPIFEEAIASNPDSVKLYYEKGITAYSSGELGSAREAFDQTLSLAPFDLPSLVMSIIVRADQSDDLIFAKKLADVVIKLAPDNAAVLDATGWLEVAMGQPQVGLELLQSALNGMQDDAAVQMHIGMGYFSLKNFENAKQYLMQSLVGELPSHLAEVVRMTLNKMQPSSTKIVTVKLINGFGVGDEIGSIELKDTEDGLVVLANLNNLPAGQNGMHIHQKPTCEAGIEDGQRIPGLAAGGHYGHDHMMMGMKMDMSDPMHAEHMKNMKPKGDLPPLETDKNGISTARVVGSKLTLAELRGRSLMIHRGPDIDGTSGPKVACAVID